MRFDTIVVPRGAEARAVEQGWPAPRPDVLTVPAGAAAARDLAAGSSGGAALVFGLCGAIDAGLAVGDAVAYARVVDGPETIELDPDLAAACARLCGRAPVVAAAVERVVGDVAAKAALRRATGAVVIDMEAAVVARALHARGMRVAMVRVVSDDAHRNLPDLRDTYDANGSLRPCALAVAFVRAPGRSARFIAGALTGLRALRRTARTFALSSASPAAATLPSYEPGRSAH